MTGGRPAGARRPGGVLGGALLVAAAACCFGSISTLTVVATRGGPSLAGVLFWRYTLAAAVLVPLAARGWRATGGSAPPVARGEWLRAVVVGGLGQAAVAFLSLSALRWITVGALGFLFYTYPAWVTLAAAVRGSERLDTAKLTALALSLLGIACTLGRPSAVAANPGAGTAGGPWPGVVLALAGAVVYALYIPYLGGLQERLTPAGASAAVCAGAAVLLAGPAVAGGGPLLHFPAASWLALAVLALACTVLAFIAFLSGLARLGPVRTAIVSTVEPFFTAVLGAVALAQPVKASTYGGGALIAAAVLLLRRPARRAAASAEVPV